MHITLKNIEEDIQPLGNRLRYDKEFIFDLLAVYGRSPANITRLRNGQLNVADDKTTEVAQKNVVYFKPVEDGRELYLVVDDLKSSPTVVRYSTRFVIVTDFVHLLAVDTKTNETLDIALRDIFKHYAFFLPWAGMEKAQFFAENHADVKAAEKMAKLFDILVASNGYTTALEWHNLTTFFTRLLFCFFAEDTNIFQKNQFSHAIASYTQEDGSDLKDFLKILFASLDDQDKEGYPAHLAAFPYVNGELFRDFSQIPNFNKESRKLLLEASSKLDWSDINPDIFGSMFQAVVRPGERTSLGQHYTSVPNIMKTIEPLFLDSLKDEFNHTYDDVRKLEKLLARISDIKILDPACGSGNFLIIAYKELRRLEHAILERQAELTGQSQQVLLGSRINIENFYGIEIDDFPHEVAILSLWLAKHQMNLEFTEKFGIDLPLIPLKESGNIVRANAARVSWNEICPNNGDEEIYLVGNPPYMGAKLQDSSQKKDYEYVFKNEPYSKNLDYIALWFIKGAHYITGTKAQLAFVTTNSVSQGEHVGLMFPKIFELGLEIGFAYTSFKWENNAKGGAGVTVAVLNLRNKQLGEKYIWTDGVKITASNINGYLADGNSDIFIERRKKQLSGLPEMVFGSMPRDGGFLVLSPSERKKLLSEYPESDKYIKKYIGSAEYIKGDERYCLWIGPSEYNDAIKIPLILDRIESVAKTRQESNAKSTRDYASKPYRFVQISYRRSPAIIFPKVSSNNRTYVPIGYVDKNTVISDLSFAIYGAAPWVLGLMTSKMHMVWLRAVAGRMGMGFRYSNTIVYNNFPVPMLTEAEKALIEEKTFFILDIRESHPEKNLAEMYDPDKMPDELRAAHQELDEAVDAVYQKKPFDNDEDRLAHLFDLYETMTANERNES
jgi:type I restriction-modification system DNA methylase subunit